MLKINGQNISNNIFAVENNSSAQTTLEISL